MSLRQLLWKPFAPLSRPQPPQFPRILRRFNSSSTEEARTRTRIDRVLNRLPRFLHPYTNGLRNAPVTHVVSFLILHEITAVMPLVGLAGLFHWTGWIPDVSVPSYVPKEKQGKREVHISEDSDRYLRRLGVNCVLILNWQVLAEGSAVSEGGQKFGRYFARKGWFGFDKQETGNTSEEIEEMERGMNAEERIRDVKKEGWNVGENGSRILVEVATAYAITKILLPARVILSVWATPWFAGNMMGGLGRVFGRGMKGSAAAGTGATAGGVMGKAVEKGGKIP